MKRCTEEPHTESIIFRIYKKFKYIFKCSEQDNTKQVCNIERITSIFHNETGKLRKDKYLAAILGRSTTTNRSRCRKK